MWILVAALFFQGQILDERVIPITFDSEEACVAHGLDNAMDFPVEVRGEPGFEYWAVVTPDGSEVWFDCVEQQ